MINTNSYIYQIKKIHHSDWFENFSNGSSYTWYIIANKISSLLDSDIVQNLVIIVFYGS